jgi:hypothetical protein
MIDLQICKHYNYIKTKLNWKLFTKVIKRPSEGSWGLNRLSVLIKRAAQALLFLLRDRVSKEDMASTLFQR